MRIRVGCSGWNYAHWRNGVFYPPRCPARRWLAYYAERFETVEVNATFYRLPRESSVARWVDETPGDFVFAVKASRYLRVATDDDFGPRVVESLAPEGVGYTAYADEAVAAVDRGEAAAAFLLQPVTVEQVARFAHAGEVMPQKSTFFYPKLTSGLLFHPVG